MKREDLQTIEQYYTQWGVSFLNNWRDFKRAIENELPFFFFFFFFEADNKLPCILVNAVSS